MRNCLPYSFVLGLLLLAVVTPSRAQEAGMSDVEIHDERESADNEKSRFLPGADIRFVPRAPGMSPAKDSIVLQIHDFPMQQATMRFPDKPAEKQNPKQKDDSILTFNFLYYIIQKYKLQDIID